MSGAISTTITCCAAARCRLREWVEKAERAVAAFGADGALIEAPAADGVAAAALSATE